MPLHCRVGRVFILCRMRAFQYVWGNVIAEYRHSLHHLLKHYRAWIGRPRHGCTPTERLEEIIAETCSKQSLIQLAPIFAVSQGPNLETGDPRDWRHDVTSSLAQVGRVCVSQQTFRISRWRGVPTCFTTEPILRCVLLCSGGVMPEEASKSQIYKHFFFLKQILSNQLHKVFACSTLVWRLSKTLST